jgi:4-amino-4-deoxy-L-arabinose transferase-like glycosyltransferase
VNASQVMPRGSQKGLTGAVPQVPVSQADRTAGDTNRRAVESERVFLKHLYLGAVLVRVLVGAAIFFTGYLEFFAGDAVTYDYFGWELAKIWAGDAQYTQWVLSRTQTVGHNGMFYWVAAGYTVLGRSPFLLTVVQILIVSLIPVLVYKTARLLFDSIPVARYAALMTAFFPSMIIWSSMLLKDSIVIFLFCVTVFFSLKLQAETKIRYAIPALAAMILIFPIRGYVFYFALLAVVGSYLMSRYGGATVAALAARLAALCLIAIVIFAFRFDEIAKQQVNANLLDQVQISRVDMARRADSGFDAAANVSTLRGAVSFLPRGVMYLLFAPFPWEGGGLRKMLAVPEMLVWYGLFPFCFMGMLYTARALFRRALIIFLFTVQLTLFYAIFQGNVGTAHRQRTQVFVFYFIFTSAGLVYSRRKARLQMRAIPHQPASPAVPDPVRPVSPGRLRSTL